MLEIEHVPPESLRRVPTPRLTPAHGDATLTPAGSMISGEIRALRSTIVFLKGTTLYVDR